MRRGKKGRWGEEEEEDLPRNRKEQKGQGEGWQWGHTWVEEARGQVCRVRLKII